MKKFLIRAFSALAMLLVMFFSAAITLRIALHGHEVTVPDFSGMTVQQASDAALKASLGLNIENRFYSTTVPAGRILSQAPAAGSRVRHGWQARVTVSLGPQQVTIPNVVGQPQRQASIDLRSDSLDLGTIAHIAAPGDPDMVLAQTPPPNAGVDQPRVSLLLSAAADGETNALVMPSFLGMNYEAASHAAAQLGVHLAAIGDIPQPASVIKPTVTVNAAGVRTDANGAAISFPASQPPPPVAPTPPPAPATPIGPVTSQQPDSGYSVNRGDTIRLTFGHPSTEPNTTPATAPAAPPAANPSPTAPPSHP
jgi:beta-lactam-binding protein with PASTA domain